jgi:3-oxoacyl-[acyl-carrier protein] reductase
MALANAGAQVLVHDDRSMARVETIVKKIRAGGGVAKAITADLSTAGGPHQLAHQTRDIVGARLDILVFNPGTPKAQPLNAATVEAFDAQFAASARAPFFLVQQLLPILNRGSSVIFTCTHTASEAVDALPFHMSTQGAIIHLMRHFAVLLEPRGIRVNVIDVLCSDIAPRTAGRVKRAPHRREGAPDNNRPVAPRCVGETIAFLASSQADQITGETLHAHLSTTHRPRREAAAASASERS